MALVDLAGVILVFWFGGINTHEQDSLSKSLAAALSLRCTHNVF